MTNQELVNSKKAYWDVVDVIAQDVKNALENDDTLDLYALFHEYVDGSEWTQSKQELIIVHTDNLHAIDEFNIDFKANSRSAIDAISFYALLKDVQEEYNALD